jgi:hypothetical protein
MWYRTAYKLTNLQYIPILKLAAVKTLIVIDMAANIVEAKVLFDKILVEGLEVNSWQKDMMSEHFTFNEEEVIPEEERVRRNAEKESKRILEEELAVADAWYENLTEKEKNYVNTLCGRYVVSAPFG